MASTSEPVDDDDEVEFVPNDRDCQKRIDDFIAITGTDEALAMFYLQDRNWNIRRSVNDYFELNKTGPQRISDSDDDIEIVAEVSNKKQKIDNSLLSVLSTGVRASTSGVTDDGDSKSLETPNKLMKEFRFITWNADGLDEKNLRLRSEAICRIIEQEKADVVFLQEVTSATEAIFREKLKHFIGLTGKSNECDHSVDYYTMTFMRKSAFTFVESEVIDFDNTIMGRSLFKIFAKIAGFDVCLINAHLESTRDFADARITQVRKALEVINSIPANFSVIFGGDLNLRDSEVDSIGGLPRNVNDVWIGTGRRKEVEFTWDTTRNDNLKIPGKARMRFDRVWFRESTPSRVIPIHFGLTGLERLKPHVCFPSDHWGVVCLFKICH